MIKQRVLSGIRAAGKSPRKVYTLKHHLEESLKDPSFRREWEKSDYLAAAAPKNDSNGLGQKSRNYPDRHLAARKNGN